MMTKTGYVAPPSNPMSVVTSFILNERRVESLAPHGMVLLDFVREVAGLPGTKEACREGECGACTLLVGTPGLDGRVSYAACASCLVPVGDVDGCHVVTVEGLSGPNLTLVQQLIVEHSATQCGFCTPGIVLSLTGFCLTSPDFSYAGALDALDGNLCRCTGYEAIRRAGCLSARARVISILGKQLTRKWLKPRRQADSPDESPDKSPVFPRRSPERARRHPRAAMRNRPRSLNFTRATPEELADH